MAWAKGFPVVATSQPLNKNCCLCWAAEIEFNHTDKSPEVGFFIPTGIFTPLAIILCN